MSPQYVHDGPGTAAVTTSRSGWRMALRTHVVLVCLSHAPVNHCLECVFYLLQRAACPVRHWEPPAGRRNCVEQVGFPAVSPVHLRQRCHTPDLRLEIVCSCVNKTAHAVGAGQRRARAGQGRTACSAS